jgi:lipopolysaccharide transport system ATP-binding protein
MSYSAITVSGLSKRYHIGERPRAYRTLRETLSDALTAPIRRIRSRNGNHGDKNFIWALRDISIEIDRGEVMGVIGRNGAGKSTLLKILSRITEPTGGSAEIRGRIACLLEVGTGFHPELTGRENIALSGAILGMKRSEIDHKFDQMVAFAEIEKFIDTPVKHYSSGMYLRLAFSVAAHLEPDILLVDEVLAVGDAAFQKKCIGKMGDVAADGRTVLFVSHNLAAMKELCSSAIVLSDGAIEFRGDVVEAIACYTGGMSEGAHISLASTSGWRGVLVEGQQHDGLSTSIECGQSFSAEAILDLGADFSGGELYCILNDALGDPIIHQRVKSNELWSNSAQVRRYRVRVELPPLWLAPGVYTVYFKLIGRRTTGAEVREISERAILDVIGSYRGIGRASLAPPIRWSASAEKPVIFASEIVS